MKEGPSGRPGGPFLYRPKWYLAGMRKILLAFAVLTACDQRPLAPSAEQNRHLDEAEAMLNEEAAHEKGPASTPAGPNSN